MSIDEQAVDLVEQEHERLREDLLEGLAFAGLSVVVNDPVWVITYKGIPFELNVLIYQPKVRQVPGAFHRYWVLIVEPTSDRGDKLTVRGNERSFRPSLAVKRIQSWLDKRYDHQSDMIRQRATRKLRIQHVAQEGSRGLPEGVELWSGKGAGYELVLHDLTKQQLAQVLSMARGWTSQPEPPRRLAPVRRLGDHQLDQILYGSALDS